MTNHSFISSARLKIAAALAAAVMLAPVTVPAIGTMAGSNGTPVLRSSDEKKAMDDAVKAAEDQYETNTKTYTKTALSFLSETDRGTYDKDIKDGKSRLDEIKASQKTANDVTTYNGVKDKAEILERDLGGLYSTFEPQILEENSSMATTLASAIGAADNIYNGLSSTEKASKNGEKLNTAIKNAKTAITNGTGADKSVKLSIKTVAPLLDALNEAIDLVKNPTPIPPIPTNPTVNDVRTSLSELSKTTKSTSTHLRNLPAYKSAKSTVDSVTQDLATGKVTTTNAASYLLDIRAKHTALETALKRSITNTGVAKINYVRGYGIQVWTWGGKVVMMDKDKTKAKKLQHGTRWKIFGDPIVQNGSTMYNLGGDQFIDKTFLSITPR